VKPGLIPSHTFAWEVNAVCVAALVAIYAALPASYVSFFYAFLFIVSVDACRYYYFRGKTPGVPYTLPFMNIVSMILHPVRFWGEQAQISMQGSVGMSTNTLAGKNMLFVTDVKLCREIMTGEGVFQIYAHPNAKWLFGPGNLIYMGTEAHKQFRALLTPALFSNEALTMYAEAQEGVCRRFLKSISQNCMDKRKELDVRIAFRSMAAAASQESFLGPYLNDTLRKDLENDILVFTLGFLCFPFPYLGTGLSKAIQAKHRIMGAIEKMMPLARQHVESGKEPRCLLEHWAVSMGSASVESTKGFSDKDIAMTVMDFLFAAQDATNSALTFACDVLATRPDVVQKVRDEVLKETKDRPLWSLIRDPERLQYTSKAAVQLLHHKPPVPMIPHLALQNTTLGGRKVPKGTVLIPSIVHSAKTSGSSATYDPDGELTDAQFVKTPIFGGGQHKCPGRRYAESLLTVFLAIMLTEYEWERVGPRPEVDDIMYYPTLFPKENMFLIRPRKE
jgi:cytochrome P450